MMEPCYNEKYYFSERHGGKNYTDSSGQKKEFGYTSGGRWAFKHLLNGLYGFLGVPQSILDIGAGCGGFVATCNSDGIGSLGLEFSQFAIDNAIMGAEKYLKRHDLAITPWPVQEKYDWVTAIDLFEHIFDEDVDTVIAEAKRCGRRWIIAKICTAQRSNEVWSAKKASYKEVVAQAEREGFEWLVVSGHVTSQTPEWWLNKLVDKNWKNRSDLSEKFKEKLKLPEDWRTTVFLENVNWFEMEFGKSG